MQDQTEDRQSSSISSASWQKSNNCTSKGGWQLPTVSG